MSDPTLLVPRPQDARVSHEPWRPPSTVRVAPLDGDSEPVLDAVLDALDGELGRRGVTLERGHALPAEIRLVRGQDAGEAGGATEAYRLEVAGDGVEVSARENAGLYRGLTTLLQWLRLARGESAVPGLRVTDWPDFPRRGLMLDVSRNRVPRMAQLYALVDLMSELKLNELQLYLEHTFAYAGHEPVWREWSPLHGDELRRLEGYARRRGVELVPNQNSFGHLHRWLVHEPYRRLAECPDGIEHPFSPQPEPFSLCPLDPGSVELLRDLYGQLLPHFRSSRFNVGLDETLDLGRCRSRQACEERGRGRVYLDFLLRVRALAGEHRRRIMFWADIVGEHPELIAALPRDAVPMVWGYEADFDFASRLAPLFAAGLETYICPGTATWNSFAGRPRTATFNLARAAVLGEGAAGYLITDWGDHGHLQPPPVSWPSYVAGAAFSWNRRLARRPDELPLASLLDRHVLLDGAGVAGRALLELGAAHLATGVEAQNGSPLFFALLFADKPPPERRGAGFDVAGLVGAEAVLASALDTLGGARMERRDAALVVRELEWAARAARLGARLAKARLRVGEAAPVEALPPALKTPLLEELEATSAELEPVWLARSRPGGLAASRDRLSSALRAQLLA